MEDNHAHFDAMFQMYGPRRSLFGRYSPAGDIQPLSRKERARRKTRRKMATASKRANKR